MQTLTASLKDRFEMRTKDMESQLIFYVKMKEQIVLYTGSYTV